MDRENDGDDDADDEEDKPVKAKELEHKEKKVNRKSKKILTEENLLDEEQKLILNGIRENAPELVSRRFKKLREWEAKNPETAKRFEEQFQEYLLQEHDPDNEDVQLPDGNTSQEMVNFLKVLNDRKLEWRSKQAKHLFKKNKPQIPGAPVQNTSVVEETLPVIKANKKKKPSIAIKNADSDDDVRFNYTEEDAPPIEYEDNVYGNARYLDFRNLRPLGDQQEDTEYSEMFGMVSNKKFERIKFGDDVPTPPGTIVVAKKKKKRKKSEEEDINVEKAGLNEITDIVGAKPKEKGMMVSHIPKDFMFTRPARKIHFVEVPVEKENYGVNWTAVQKETTKKVRKKKQLPEFLHKSKDPTQLYGLIMQKAELNSLVTDSGVGASYRDEPVDYFDWLLKGTQLASEDEDPTNPASKEKHKWFHSPPTYHPASPTTSLDGDYDFCGYGNREKPYFVPGTVPRHVLLYQCMYKKQDDMFNRVQKPPGSFPGYALPRWLMWGLDHKLPQHTKIPQDVGYWSRGIIGQSLKPTISRKEFKLDDPLNLNGIEYDPLHDEQCMGFFERGPARDALHQQHLISEEGDVYCTQKQQNDYRRYLRYQVWRNECDAAYKMMSDRKLHQIKAAQMLRNQSQNWPKKKAKWLKTIKSAQALNEEKSQIIKRKVERSIRERNRRLEQLNKMKELKCQQKKEDTHAYYPNQNYFMLKKYMPLINKQRHVNIIMKQYNANEIRKASDEEKKFKADEKKRLRWQKKMQSMDENAKLKEWAFDKITEDRRRRIANREEKIRAHRERIPDMYIEQQLEQLRIKRLVRKYAMRWLNIVRQRKLLQADAAHISTFQVQKSLDTTVEDLMTVSGTQKLETLIAGLLGALNFKSFGKTSLKPIRKTLPEGLQTIPDANEFTFSKFPLGSSSSVIPASSGPVQESKTTVAEVPSEQLPSLASVSTTESEFTQQFHHMKKQQVIKEDTEEEEEEDELDETDQEILDDEEVVDEDDDDDEDD